MIEDMSLDITSANATAVLSVEGIFPEGVMLQQFGTDQALGMERVTIAETRKGVDGKLVAGFLPVIYPVSVTLEASSPSRQSLATVWQAMNTNRAIYLCTLVCAVPSLGLTYTWSNGVMTGGTPFPSLEKTLAPTVWRFDFQDFEQSAI